MGKCLECFATGSQTSFHPYIHMIHMQNGYNHKHHGQSSTFQNAYMLFKIYNFKILTLFWNEQIESIIISDFINQQKLENQYFS